MTADSFRSQSPCRDRKKKVLVAGIVAAVFCGAPALAADMPAKAPVYKAAALANWTGCYAEDVGGPDVGDFLGGGQIGCDYPAVWLGD